MSVTDKANGGSLRDRLQSEAIELFQRDGYENVTAAQIASAVGVTERTFFRYFPDKREVLFGAETMVRDAIVAGIRDAPDGMGSVDMIFHAFDLFRPITEKRRSYAKPRQELIDAHPGLQERELAKIASLVDSIARELEARGVPALHANLAARIGMAGIAQATHDWLSDDAISLGDRLDQARRALRQLAG